MARIRSVKPEFWGDRRLARVSRDARLLYISLWNLADEHGRLQGDARWIKGHCFPYDDDLDDTAVRLLLGELEGLGRVQRYDADGDPYLFLPKLAAHQRLEPGKSESRLPEPPSPPVPTVAPAQTFPDSAQIVSDEPAPIVAQHVAGSREHVAGSRLQGAGVQGKGGTTTAQTLIGEWIETCHARPPSRIIGQVSKHVAELLAEGTDPEHVRRGLDLWQRKGLHPSTLASVVNEAMNSSPYAVVKPKPSTTDMRFNAAMALADQYRDEETREQIRDSRPARLSIGDGPADSRPG